MATNKELPFYGLKQLPSNPKDGLYFIAPTVDSDYDTILVANGVQYNLNAAKQSVVDQVENELDAKIALRALASEVYTKLETYTRDEIDADIDEAVVRANSAFQGTAVPTTPALSQDGFVIATQAGTYTNLGNVVVPINSLAVISKTGSNYSASITTIPVPDNKINQWTAKPYTAGQQVLEGDIWYEAVVNTTAAQRPGVVAETIWKKILGTPSPLTQDTHLKFTEDSYYNTNVTPMSPTPTPITTQPWSSASAITKENERWFVKGLGGTAIARLWSFTKADGTIISNAVLNENTNGLYKELRTPAGAERVYFNVVDTTPFDVYKKSAMETGLTSLRNDSIVEGNFTSADATQGAFYALQNPTVPAAPSAFGDYEYLILSAKKGDTFVISGEGGLNSRLWATVAADGTILNRAPQYLNTRERSLTVKVTEANADKIYINNLWGSTGGALSVIKISEPKFNVIKSGYRQANVVWVAAADSDPQDKARADYVCTGINDELTIQKAVDALVYGGTVWLFLGTYKIDSFPERDAGVPPTAIYLRGSEHRFVEIRAVVKAQFALGRKGALLTVSQEAYDALDDNTQVAIIGGAPAKAGYFYYNSLFVSDLLLETYGNYKPTISIDFRKFSNGGISGVRAYGLLTFVNIYYGSGRAPVPHPQSVGIYGFEALNSAYYTQYLHSIVLGYGEGFKMGGDHVYMLSCAVGRCTYPYTFGTFSDSIHPMTMIKCNAETNTNYPFFGRFATQQPITMIDFSCESLSARSPEPFNKFAQEEIPGTFSGSIEWASSPDPGGAKRFWENDGSGKNFRTKNLHHAEAGNTATRLGYTPSLWQRFYDLDLRADLTYDGTRWVRADGSSATVLKIGPTAQRPALDNTYLGYVYFDTTINKSITLKSSGVWVDVNGNVV